jgi:hypothetical protein
MAPKKGFRQKSPKQKAVPTANKLRAKAKRSAPRTEAQYSATPEKFKKDKVSLTQASRDAGISPRTVTRWGSSALKKLKNGRYAPKAADNLLRIVMIPTPEGTRDVAVRGSKQVSLLAKYSNALHRYIQTGDASQLMGFRGKYIKDANGVDVPLSTDLAMLNRLGSAGELSFESLYARTT